METLNLEDYRPPEKVRKDLKARRKQHLLRKLEALVEADYRCTRCGTDHDLTVHHLTKIRGKRDKRTVLCVTCHHKAHDRL